MLWRLVVSLFVLAWFSISSDLVHARAPSVTDASSLENELFLALDAPAPLFVVPVLTRRPTEGVAREVMRSSYMKGAFVRLHTMLCREGSLSPPQRTWFRQVHRRILAAGGEEVDRDQELAFEAADAMCECAGEEPGAGVAQVRRIHFLLDASEGGPAPSSVELDALWAMVRCECPGGGCRDAGRLFTKKLGRVAFEPGVLGPRDRLTLLTYLAWAQATTGDIRGALRTVDARPTASIMDPALAEIELSLASLDIRISVQSYLEPRAIAAMHRAISLEPVVLLESDAHGDAVTGRLETLEHLDSLASAYLELWGIGEDHPDLRYEIYASLVGRKGRVQDLLSRRISRFRKSPEGRDVLLRWSSILQELSRSALGTEQTGTFDETTRRLAREEAQMGLERVLLSGAEVKTRTSVAEIAAAIPNGSVLLDFYYYHRGSEPRYFLILVGSEGLVGGGDIGAARDIDQMVSALRQSIQRRDRAWVDEGRLLYRVLLEPFRHNIRGYTHLIVSPDAHLSFLPFAVLMQTDQLLIDEYEISYTTSPRDLLRLAGPRGSSRGVVAMGRPARAGVLLDLPGTDAELRSVARARRKGEPVSFHLGRDASEGVIRSLDGPRILHIVSHGYYAGEALRTPYSMRDPRDVALDLVTNRRRNPDDGIGLSLMSLSLVRSGMLLADSGATSDGDGILTALEALSLDLEGTQLVVLSACDTGVGDAQSGHGTFGLRRSFSIAGARTVVTSLWPISDYTTPLLMETFYDNLRQGLGPSESMRRAQLELAHGEEFSQPLYWAPFVVEGDWRSMEPVRERPPSGCCAHDATGSRSNGLGAIILLGARRRRKG